MLKSIRCSYCKKLLFSSRWKGKREYDRNHRCPDMAEALRRSELDRVLDQLYAGLRLLSRVCAQVTQMAEEAARAPARVSARRRRQSAGQKQVASAALALSMGSLLVTNAVSPKDNGIWVRPPPEKKRKRPQAEALARRRALKKARDSAP